jgi:hypothetical protein
MPFVDIQLLITADEFVKRYRLPNAVVVARADDGRRVRFPASALQRFVTHSGISGRFRIGFDDKGKLVGVERVSEIGG